MMNSDKLTYSCVTERFMIIMIVIYLWLKSIINFKKYSYFKILECYTYKELIQNHKIN